MFISAIKQRRWSGWSRRSRAHSVFVFSAVLAGVLAAAEVCATTFSWNNSLGGAFDSASNWTPAGGPPAAAFDTAIFDIFAAYEVEFFDDFTNSSLEVVSPGVTLNLYEDPMFGDPTSHTYSLAATLGTAADVSSMPGSLFPAVLTVTGGEVEAGGTLYIGRDANSTGQLNLAGGSWDSTGITYVGLNGDGTLVIDFGYLFSVGLASGAGRIGWGVGSSGSVTVNDRWDISGDLTVGSLGDGTMTIDGGDVSNVVGVIATGADSTSSVTVSSVGTWDNSDALFVGGNSTSAGGSGTLTINTVGAVTATNVFQVWPTGVVSVINGSLNTGGLTNLGDMTLSFGATANSVSGVVGDESASVGSATVELINPGTTWMMTGDLHVGGRDTSDLTISLGAVVSNANALVAVDPLASADITLTMAGAQWTSSGSVYLGGNASTAGGSGTTQVQVDTTMDVAGTLKVWDNYLLTIDGGMVITPTLDVSGTVDVTGALDLTESGTVGALVLSGGTVNADSFDFGSTSLVGFGTLNGLVAVGGDVTATGDLTIGDATSFDGVVIGGNLNVGAQSVSINKKGFFSVGTSTVITGGTLTVSDGVAIPISAGLVGRGTINGRIVQQAGSNITATGDLTLGDAASSAGFFSDGEMAVENKNRITLLDANEAVLGSLTTLGGSGLTGAVNAANGAVLEFGKNIVGHGFVETPDDSTKPLINNGSIAGNSMEEPITLNGYVKGVGTCDNCDITGTDAPGFSTAAVNRGSVSYNGTLEIEIGGTPPGSGYDQLNHILGTGIAELGGTLDVLFLDGFIPSLDDTFDILTATGGVNGTFTNTLFPDLGALLAIDLFYGTNTVTLAVVPALPGDFDIDSDVDGFDFLQWQRGESPNPLSQSDLDDWQDNFGNVASPITAASTTVPESATWLMLMLGMAIMLTGGRTLVSKLNSA
jgi:T5SS/PEP-CTERM-associated repeat protein